MVSPEAAFNASRNAMRGDMVRGVSDCLFAATKASKALYGRDPLAVMRPEYSTYFGALRILHRHCGHLSWASAAFSAAGMIETGGIAAGSLVLAKSDTATGGLTFGISLGNNMLAAKSDTGLIVIRANIKGAWVWD